MHGGSVMAIISRVQRVFLANGSRPWPAPSTSWRTGSMRPRRILLLEGDDGAFTATTAPTKNGPALPDLLFRLDKAGLIRRCRRIGKRPFAVPASRPSCNPITSLCVRSIFQSGRRVPRWHDPGADRSSDAMDRRRFHIRLEFAHGGRERPDRVTFAATSKLLVEPCASSSVRRDAVSVAISRRADIGPSAWIKLLDQPLRSRSVRQITSRACCARVLLSAGVAARGLASDRKLSWRFAANRT